MSGPVPNPAPPPPPAPAWGLGADPGGAALLVFGLLGGGVVGVTGVVLGFVFAWVGLVAGGAPPLLLPLGEEEPPPPTSPPPPPPLSGGVVVVGGAFATLPGLAPLGGEGGTAWPGLVLLVGREADGEEGARSAEAEALQPWHVQWRGVSPQ